MQLIGNIIIKLQSYYPSFGHYSPSSSINTYMFFVRVWVGVFSGAIDAHMTKDKTENFAQNNRHHPTENHIYKYIFDAFE